MLHIDGASLCMSSKREHDDIFALCMHVYVCLLVSKPQMGNHLGVVRGMDCIQEMAT